MKKAKQLVALILVVVLFVTVVPIHSWGIENTTSNNDALSLLSQINYERLCLLVEQNGEVNDDGFKSVLVEKYTYDSGENYSVFLTCREDDVLLQIEFKSGSYSSVVDAIIDPTSTQIEVQNQLKVSYETVNNSLTIDRTLHSYDSQYTVVDGGKYLGVENVSQIFSLLVQLMCAETDEYLYENLDFGLYGLGFENYYFGGSLCDEHEYGILHSDVKNVHYRTCSGCHFTDCEEHNWINGSEENTCDVCGRVEIIKETVETPNKPELVECTISSVTLRKIEGYEYSKNGRKWQDSNVFTGLTANTEYVFYQRIKETDKTYGSDISGALKVKTGVKSACSIKPVAPIVQDYNYNTIVLVARDGYEYSLGNGIWTTNCTFTGLSEDTSYTVYQRIAECEDEYASEASAGVVVKTTSTESYVSAATYYDELRSYIETFGSDGITMYTTASNGGTITFSMKNTNDGIKFGFSAGSTASTRINGETTFILSRSSSTIAAWTREQFIVGNMLKESAAETLDIDRSTYSESSYYTLYIYGLNYITYSDFSDHFNQSMLLLCTHWDIYMNAYLGFGLKELGFLSFSEEESTVCDPLVSHHVGDTEIRNVRNATCTLDGYTGDTYCTSCGEKVSSGSEIPYTVSHSYTNSCDKSCDNCGEERRVDHTYSCDCDRSCDICNFTRTIFVHHNFNQEGVCIECEALECNPGDINGDEKIDSVDGLMLMHYLNGWDVNITSPDAMDVNCDGEVNSLDGLILMRYLNDWDVTIG